MVSMGPKFSMEHCGRRRFAFADISSAREEIQMGIFQDTFWLWYAWCCGLGCLSPFREGCCLNIGQCCCCAGTCRDAACWDNDGIMASTVKICCCVWHSECPPSMTPGCGCCGYPFSGCFFCKNMPPPNILENPRGLDPNEREEFQIITSTCWCCFLYCCGFGCNPPGNGMDTCCKVEGKLCCFWMNLETDDSYEEQIAHTQKCCCLVWDASLPAGRTPGCGCCNCLCGGNVMPPYYPGPGYPGF
jgi:hypothetical protein